jgi:hypothetical protein
MVNHRVALGAAAIAAVLSMPALADELVTNGGFEDNFGAGLCSGSITSSRAASLGRSLLGRFGSRPAPR